VIRSVFVAVFLTWTIAGGDSQDSPSELPPRATTALAASVKAADAHRQHVWRDTVPINADGTVNAYIEIARGDRRKFEFDMSTNALKLDRMIPEAIGGYAVNYGYVPQTVSYDGDPFDALVLGPAIKEGQLVRGVIVGVMFMEDEKGLDSKVVLSRTTSDGKALHQLSAADQQEIGDFFKRYKENQPGMFSKVPGWGSIEQGLKYVTNTHAFFTNCRARAGVACRA
jgi:inorganic pyrophosphatase